MISNNNLSNDNTVITGHNEKLTQEHSENNGEKTPNKRRSIMQIKEETRPTHRTKRFTRQDKKKEVKKNVEQKKDKPRIPVKKHGKVVKNTPNKIAFKNRKKMEKKEKFGQMKDNNVKSNYAEIALRKQEVKKNVEQQRKKHKRETENIDTQLVKKLNDHMEAERAKKKQEVKKNGKQQKGKQRITVEKQNTPNKIAYENRKKMEIKKKEKFWQMKDNDVKNTYAKIAIRKQVAEQQRKKLERVKEITNNMLLKNINDSVGVALAKRKQQLEKNVEQKTELNELRSLKKNVIVRNLKNAFDLVAEEDRFNNLNTRDSRKIQSNSEDIKNLKDDNGNNKGKNK